MTRPEYDPQTNRYRTPSPNDETKPWIAEALWRDAVDQHLVGSVYVEVGLLRLEDWANGGGLVE